MSNRYRSTLSLGSSTPAFTNTKSIALDGVDDFVSTGLNLSYTTYPNVSFSCWIKMDKASLNTFTSYSPTGAYVQIFPNSSPIRILTNGTKQAFVFVQGNGSSQSTTDLSDGNWHHIVQTARYEASGTVNNVYVDGVKEITNQLFHSYAPITGDFFVGARNSTTQFFVGGIDEVAVFDSELAQSDITAIYGTGVPTSLATYNPLLWYRCGDGDTAPTLTDNGSGGNNGTMTNFSTFSSDVPVELFSRKSIALDGVDDFVDCGSVSAINSASTVSVSYWGKKTASNKYLLVGSQMSSTNGLWLTWWNDGNVYFAGRNGNIGFAAYALSFDTNFHHFVGVYNGSSLKIYIDGILRATSTTSIPSTLSSTAGNDFNIGYLQLQYASGNIDEVSVFNSELSASDVTAIYGSGVPTSLSSYSSLISWWRCGDGDTAPTLTDNGSGSNNGTMTNFSTFSTDVPT